MPASILATNQPANDTVVNQYCRGTKNANLCIATSELTGSVRRAGTALRVTAELMDAGTVVPIWSEKFAGTMDDVFGIQEEIARQIAAALEVTLTTEEERGVAERPFDDPDTAVGPRHDP